MLKRIIAGVFCIVISFTFIGWNLFEKDESFYKISIFVKADYQQEFNNKEFTSEDFGLDNVKVIIYDEWMVSTPDSFGIIKLYLKDARESQALNAVEHFRALYFVKDALMSKEDLVLYKVGVKIKSDYQQEFDNREFTIEDFRLDNIEHIDYHPFQVIDDSNPNRYIRIHLKKSGRNYVLDAINHFKALYFVEDADVVAIGFELV